jgi:hypothetical protein
MTRTIGDPTTDYFESLVLALARAALTRNIASRDLCNALKMALVRLCLEDGAFGVGKATVSRIATRTGLPRKTVAALAHREIPVSSEPAFSPIHKLIHRWRTDPDFLDHRGRPRPLSSAHGEATSFRELVRRVGSDLNYAPCLQEMEDRGLIRRTKLGLLRLARAPSSRSDSLQHLACQHAARDISGAVAAVTTQLGMPAYQKEIVFGSEALKNKFLSDVSQRAMSLFDLADGNGAGTSAVADAISRRSLGMVFYMYASDEASRKKAPMRQFKPSAKRAAKSSRRSSSATRT